MDIYLDVVFVLNGTINYLLLRTSAALFGRSPEWKRTALAAAFGALYACVTFLPGFTFLSGALWRLAALLLMLVLAYGASRQAIYPGLGFAALSMALSGIILMLGSDQIWLYGGRAYYAVGFPTLVLTAGAVFLAARLLLGGLLQHSGGVEPAELAICGRRVSLRMLRDTGNTLRDPFTGRALPVVEWEVVARLVPDARAALAAASSNPAQVMERLHRDVPELALRLVPFRAVGTQRALLLCVRCDTLRVRGRELKKVFVAISPTKVSEKGNFEGLIGEGE